MFSYDFEFFFLKISNRNYVIAIRLVYFIAREINWKIFSRGWLFHLDESAMTIEVKNFYRVLDKHAVVGIRIF